MKVPYLMINFKFLEKSFHNVHDMKLFLIIKYKINYKTIESSVVYKTFINFKHEIKKSH